MVGALTGSPVAFALTLAALVAVGVHLFARRRISSARGTLQHASDLHLATIEALARAIDAKDQTAEDSIRRLQAYAVGLAKAVGLTATDIEGIKTAALLHDVGKLAIPEHILSKPGPLTPEELQKVRRHSEVGAEILATVPYPYPVATLIHSHHERWDGNGYPAGLHGEEIPVGARILHIVDYFDAVMSDRPYHKALSYETAVALLQHESGRALDPNLVTVFLERLPQMKAHLPGTAGRQVPDAAPAAFSPSGVVAGPASTRTVFEDIALAHREIYALYEIAQSMGTSLGVAETMALISSKVANIVPWSTCSLFLYTPSDDTVTCRYAAGTDAPHLVNRTLASGTGLSGWVAKHRRTLMRSSRLEADPEALAGSTFESALVCPLMLNDRFIGTLGLYHADPNRYTDDHRRLLEQVGDQAAAVIKNSIVFEQTRVDSLTDPLTALPNRRSLFAHLSRELARAERLQHEVAVIVMDVDDFKAINDTYGHQVGDRALRVVAAALHISLRPYDLCVRYAGDEFVVVLSDCSRESAEAKRRELQHRVSEVRIEVVPGRTLLLGVSAGCSVFPQDGTSAEAILADADLLMYRDKALRRTALPPALIPPPSVPTGTPQAIESPEPPGADPRI